MNLTDFDKRVEIKYERENLITGVMARGCDKRQKRRTMGSDYRGGKRKGDGEQVHQGETYGFYFAPYW